MIEVQDSFDIDVFAGLHWSSGYLNITWAKDADGPDSYNCWYFTRFIQREHYGIDMSISEVDMTSQTKIIRSFEEAPERGNWTFVREPQDGDIVEMGSARHPHHIGTWVAVDEGRVLHCFEGHGVCCQPLSAMYSSGWGHIRFLRHKSRM